MLFINSEAIGLWSFVSSNPAPTILAVFSILMLLVFGRHLTFYLRAFRLSLIIAGIFFSQFSQAQNAIVTENILAGNPYSDWGVINAGAFRNPDLNGFATEISVNRGSTVHFKIDGQDLVNYTIQIYRLGYYDGNGASLKADLGTFPGIKQPAGIADPVTGLLDCSNWTESASWAIPSTAVSGIYIAKIESAAGRNHIVFIVRDDASNSDLLLQANDATWQAYNGYGGNNLYNGTTSFPSGHATHVSYNRPFFVYNTGFSTDGRGSDWYMNDSYPMLRWLERNGYDLTYTTNVDVARSGSLLLNHKIFITAGHDEYWSREQRDNVEAARNAGVNCAFFTGNEVYWKTRWEPDANGNPFHTLICYKEGSVSDGESSCGFKCDVTSSVWTGLWRSGAAYDAPLPENALTGQISWSQSDNTSIQVPDTYKNMRFWRNTSVAGLAVGQIATLGTFTLGYEWDFEQYPNSYPNGRMTLSSTTINNHTHKLSLYRYNGSGGPLVFGAGTVQWAWGLDDQHFGGINNQVSKDIQQATVNLFADMGVQPETEQNDLMPATASTDVTDPVSVITSPADGSNQTINGVVTISGTASDDNTVAGVEISVDGGTTWKIANGTTNWTYSWTPLTQGTYTIKSRGYDDTGNMEVPVNNGSNIITITLGPSVCPCHIFTSQVPVAGTSNDNGTSNNLGGQELGLKFQSGSDGYITGIRFYKTAGNTGTHIGELYTADGTRLSQATFTNETATGWQTVSFGAPVHINANTTYVAAYFSSLGNYVEDNDYFNGNSVINSPLIALAEGTDGPNAPYVYTAVPAFPNQFFASANYWVDVTFTYTADPTAFAGNNQTINLPSSSVTLDGSGSTGTITDYQWTLVSGPNIPTITTPTGVSTTVTGLIEGVYVFQLAINSGFSTSQVTITVNPPPPPVANAGNDQTILLPVTTVTLDGSNSTGVITDYTWTKISGPGSPVITTPTTVSTTVTGLTLGTYVFQLSLNSGVSTSQVTINVLDQGSSISIFTTQAPPDITSNDFQSPGIELGVKFRSAVSGFITGVRFYKTTLNSGTHTGELYAIDGTRLAQAVFTNETTLGWQNVTFTTPVAIVPNTTYVAAYFSSAGNYVGTANYFTSAIVNSPLTGLADGADGPNGVYLYTATPSFPINSPGNHPNYWVDVLFTEGSIPLPVTYLNFTVSKQGSDVKLQWTTSMEQNNRGFEVQRSTDGSSWNVIGFVKGMGNSQASLYYSFADKLIEEGIYYYRLRQVDYDGKSEISKILQVSYGLNLSLELLQNRPNPFNSVTTIDMIIPKAGRVELILYDQMGRPLQQLMNEVKMAGKYSIPVNRNGLSSGTYYYKLSALGQTLVRKMTIL